MPIFFPLLRLAIENKNISPSSANFRLADWPPPFDFPVVVDQQGNVISRFGDSRWDVSSWTHKSLVINFGDGPQRKNAPSISASNADVLRLIAAWLLWGPRAARTATTLAKQIMIVRPLFIHCSRENISAKDIERFPNVIEMLVPLLSANSSQEFLRIFHMLYDHRDFLGFCIFSPATLKRIAASYSIHRKRQTAYIPPRIWLYQVTRLREFLDDFHTNRERIEACYDFCIQAYVNNFGGPEGIKRKHRGVKANPFTGVGFFAGSFKNAQSYGSFVKTAQQFGIEEVLMKWCNPSSKFGLLISTFARYLRLVIEVGCAYLLNFSMMRIEECWTLRCGCLELERDESFGDVYLLRGSTTKTIKDDDALWITSPSSHVAVDAMATVTRLRIRWLLASTDLEPENEEVRNPYLASKTTEPWSRKSGSSELLRQRHNYPNYRVVLQECPKLFDLEQLRITENDLNLARLVTPDLNGSQYKVGEIWPLSWHQLRRTGAVNMQSSGLVSDPSIQYQLKHTSRAMSLYYGQGFSHVRLNETARTEYIRTMYEVQGIEISRLFSNQFVSPYGADHKAEMLQLVSEMDHKQLTMAAKAGLVSWRETLLGGCTKRGPCTYGGIDNIARCGGGDGRAPCIHALFDKEKIKDMHKLKEIIDFRLSSASRDSPYFSSLEAQKLALENAFNATK